MADFVDPRTHPKPHSRSAGSVLAESINQVEDLHRLCRDCRIYEIEDWIKAGRPLQLAPQARPRGRRTPTALEIALETGQQALIHLLLCNGYRLDLEPFSPFNLALKARRWDLVDLLWAWGADPTKVSPYAVFDTYNTGLFERFYAAGLDLTRYHQLADTLASHASNKPLFGFAKRHRETEPRIQVELNIALGQHAREGNLKGVHLCLWAGADPHALAPELRCDYEPAEGVEEGERFTGWTPIEEAVMQGHVELLPLLKPDPARDKFEDLYLWARDGRTVEALARIAPPRNAGPVIQHRLLFLDARWPQLVDRRGVSAVEAVFKMGGRWIETTAEEIKAVRHGLRNASDSDFVQVLKLLAQGDHCRPEILRELGRSASLRQRMVKVGLLPPPQMEATRQHNPAQVSGSRNIASKFGIPIPKVKPTPPRVVVVGDPHPNGTTLRLDRRTLYDRVWAEPVDSLAETWGLSRPGLAKVCQRMGVPVPPRGYWAKVQHGARLRRTPLRDMPGGNPTEIIIHVPPRMP